jgi:hypothetical protein
MSLRISNFRLPKSQTGLRLAIFVMPGGVVAKLADKALSR